MQPSPNQFTEPFKDYHPELFPRVLRAGKFLRRALSPLPEKPLSRGDHTFPKDHEHEIGRMVMNGEISAQQAFDI